MRTAGGSAVGRLRPRGYFLRVDATTNFATATISALLSLLLKDGMAIVPLVTRRVTS